MTKKTKYEAIFNSEEEKKMIIDSYNKPTDKEPKDKSMDRHSKPNKVIVRTYCECGCDCPTCHICLGDKGKTKVEDCVYCQFKWAGKGQYDPEFRKQHPYFPELEEVTYNPTPTDTQEPNCYDKKGNRIPFCYDDKLKKATKDCAKVLESESTDTQTKIEKLNLEENHTEIYWNVLIAEKINEIIEVLNEK